jgi:hypothetical protein
MRAVLLSTGIRIPGDAGLRGSFETDEELQASAGAGRPPCQQGRPEGGGLSHTGPGSRPDHREG